MRAALKRPGLWLALVCAAVCAALGLCRIWACRGLDSQTAAERWRGEGDRLCQVSVFLSEDAAFDENGVMGLRSSVDESLSAIYPDRDSATAWTDCYSAVTSVTAAAGASTQQARAIATGGDFFTFHPLAMSSGWYYSQRDLADDLVVLDELLAWQLFGSTDVTGLAVQIGGWPCTVAGVAKTPAQTDEAAAYGDAGTLYMSYSLLSRLEDAPAITCYEAVLPEAVKGFAAQTVQTALSLPADECELQENTNRFTFSHSLALSGQLSRRVQRMGRVYFPYWENAARAAETKASLLAAACLVAAGWPVLYGGYWALRGLRRLRRAAA